MIVSMTRNQPLWCYFNRHWYYGLEHNHKRNIVFTVKQSARWQCNAVEKFHCLIKAKATCYNCGKYEFHSLPEYL